MHNFTDGCGLVSAEKFNYWVSIEGKMNFHKASGAQIRCGGAKGVLIAVSDDLMREEWERVKDKYPE